MRTFSLLVIVILLATISANGQDRLVVEALNQMMTEGCEAGFSTISRNAATNDLHCQYLAALCHEKGIGTQADPQKAFMLVRRCAERGLAEAMFHLADMYQQGIGIEPNGTRAQQWRDKANAKSQGATPSGLEIQLYAAANNAGNQRQDKYPDTATKRNAPQTEQRNTPLAPAPTPQYTPGAATHNNLATTQIQQGVTQEKLQKRKSDVDLGIPAVQTKRENTFALIIANENYQEVANVNHAHNDGEIFTAYCIKTLGIPESNVRLVKDATYNNIRREVSRLCRISESYEGAANLLIYYAGHGMPDEKTGAAYLLPVDGSGSDPETCYPVTELFANLERSKPAKAVIITDACFSGALRGDGMLMAARGIAIKSNPSTPSGRICMIAGAQGDETAWPYDEQAHGLFTYCLLMQLKTSKGSITLGELTDNVTQEVRRKSIVVNGKQQTPAVNASPTVESEWRGWTLF